MAGDRTVEVIILNWNGAGVVLDCLASLEAVDDPPIRVTVVDNGSTDGSPSLVREKYPSVDVIENGANLMFAEGNNVGIRHALENGAEYVLLLNNDTEVDSRFLREMMKGFDDERVGIVGPKIFYFDDPDRIWYGGGSFMSLSWIPRHDGIRKIGSVPGEKAGQTSWVTGCAMLVRSAVFEEVGLLDPSYRIYCEDIDLCLRAVAGGWQCRYEPGGKVWHKVSSSSGGGMTPFKLENRIASTARLMRRFRPLWWRVLMSPAHLAGLALLAGVMLAGGRPRLAAAVAKGAARALGNR